MALRLYTTAVGPPSRAVLLCEKAIGLNLEHIEINLLQGDHMSPELVKMNPQHTIPTLTDDDIVIWDSHAIMAYLVGKYGGDCESLYPKDLAQRSLVDQRLHFDSGCIFYLVRRIGEGIMCKDSITPDETCKSLAHRNYQFLDDFLIDKDWVCGNSITIADFSLISSVTTLDLLVPIGDTYPNITAWLGRAEELSYYDVNRSGLEKFKEFIEIISTS
ncbi:PREDICTED: glutathione S-transferase 1 [Nicrophorus vespilloides]|uniref:Glutathione S-transferase 1 n=1 Tax=Nicrophorus vespilloides TaxID=110193 RepID=A0ABM1NFW3_NICVS|nr:PREDICTED: glutathione S-transferase 1 [Nicrophorus vespilloides]